MTTAQAEIYRVVTASSLFDGHDAAINLFRRILQKAGCEVIHIGHNRSVAQIVTSALQEDAHAVCVSSYQGGHMEFFRFLRDSLDAAGAKDVKIFGGGGGTILPSEIEELQEYGVTRLYHAEDGRKLGLRGVIRDAIQRTTPVWRDEVYYGSLLHKLQSGDALDALELAKIISLLEQPEHLPDTQEKWSDYLGQEQERVPPVIGVTGPGGAGKSSLVDELVNRFLHCTKKGRVAILAFDPTKKTTGGALLGDRIRMNSIYDERVFLRSMATRGAQNEMSLSVVRSLQLLKMAQYDLVILETTGIGQGDAGIVDLSDLALYVMTSEYGASSQLEKIDMIDLADVIVLNKFDRLGALDAYDDVLHAYARAHDQRVTEASRETFPVYGTIASNFNDPGVSRLFKHVVEKARDKGFALGSIDLGQLYELADEQVFTIIPAERTFYLGEIAETVNSYLQKTERLADQASLLYRLVGAEKQVSSDELIEARKEGELKLGKEALTLIDHYSQLWKQYGQDELAYTVREQEYRQPLFSRSLAETRIPKIARPQYRDWGDQLAFMRKENYPGYFPYTAGVFPLKSEAEDPKRQFAGEGSPQRTNRRFHYLCDGEAAKRLSTAFDSVTLYGEEPALQLDVYGKVGTSGVSVSTLDDMKALYKDFDLVDKYTSVSLTINGPAPMILAMFLNTAIDFEVEKQTGKQVQEVLPEQFASIKEDVLHRVRGTVQADILKEEQAQNTCIFSSQFALKMMGDIQEYFITHNIQNFYSVSVSGYHIAEAGANPITQLAFTLANGFTYVEYYLARGMSIDDFASRLSFFFSSGLDPEYSVIGRVARRIWSVVLREKYGADYRSCRLKYHIQTSGRSLHAQEIAFNDIRTTLQALMAIYDNCNSLHTNAYDEAITTPTEESVRRAMAIQLILTKEFGPAKCVNPAQGSFLYNELTDLVEQAVLQKFAALSRRGGVLGAMEKQYQRHAIQTESMKYEVQKFSGELPIIGVNTFLSKEGQPDYEHIEVVRGTEEEKQEQVARCKSFIDRAGDRNQQALQDLRQVALSGENIFEELMDTVRYASLGQITHLLYTCGGQYRRSM